MLLNSACGRESDGPLRCEVVPLPDHQVSFTIDGKERLRWHFGPQYPRPFFYPLNGPSGVSLTRMGHPGAQNHDHHRSVWFAHQSVNDIDFWSDNTSATVRQKFWYRYRDGNEECLMASSLGWFDERGVEVMQQDLVVAVLPLADNEYTVEFQITLSPGAQHETVTLGKTNFGILAMRVSKSLSAFFGGGTISDSEGNTGEEQIFGKQARWMDYSGPVAVGTGATRQVVAEGITCFDHPQNLRHPTFWHVRSDGWMGASYGMQAAHPIDRQNPLTLRYLIHVHSGRYDAETAAGILRQFEGRPGFLIRKAKPQEMHQQYEVERLGKSPGL
ncbi:MAG: PmoA family protein [Planctomycetaceae bacterium]